MMLIGFIIGKLKIVKCEESDALTKITLYLLTPVAIINAFCYKRTNAISMLTAGILATKIDFKTALKNKSMYIISLARTVAYPVISLFIVKLLSFISIVNCKQILLISFLASITPVSSSIMQFAQIKHDDTDLAVQINIFVTILSVATMPVWSAIYTKLIQF